MVIKKLQQEQNREIVSILLPLSKKNYSRNQLFSMVKMNKKDFDLKINFLSQLRFIENCGRTGRDKTGITKAGMDALQKMQEKKTLVTEKNDFAEWLKKRFPSININNLNSSQIQRFKKIMDADKVRAFNKREKVCKK
jgi:hypothetical protein